MPGRYDTTLKGVSLSLFRCFSFLFFGFSVRSGVRVGLGREQARRIDSIDQTVDQIKIRFVLRLSGGRFCMCVCVFGGRVLPVPHDRCLPARFQRRGEVERGTAHNAVPVGVCGIGGKQACSTSRALVWLCSVVFHCGGLVHRYNRVKMWVLIQASRLYRDSFCLVDGGGEGRCSAVRRRLPQRCCGRYFRV